MVHNPEFQVWMVYDGDRLPGGGGDLVVSALKIDGLVVIDSAGYEGL